jgi:hypothetical protein
MQNRAMLRKITSGQCIDISDCMRTVDGHYVLREFVEGKDYCDAADEAWIWSIGKHRETGIILASRASDLYQNPEVECLFLR